MTATLPRPASQAAKGSGHSFAAPASERRIVFAGGGTGGHLFPGLAVAEQLRTEISAERITFVGSGSAFEQQHVAAAGFAHRALACRSWKARPRHWPGIAWAHARGLWQAHALLRELGPAVVVGLGGYASLPMALAAVRRGLPLLLVEQNALPGKANRLLARHAAHICLGFDAARQHLSRIPAERLTITGTPLRSGLASRGDELPIELRSARQDERLLLVCGGSGGARQLNENVPLALERVRSLLAGWRIIHQAGALDCQATRDRYRSLHIDATVVPFIEHLPRLLGLATVTICRAGGTTLAELAATAAPAIVCPFPWAADDHQRENAAVFARSGACRLVDLPPDEQAAGVAALAGALARLLTDSHQREQLAAAIRRLAAPQASQQVAQIVLDMLAAAC